MPRTWVTMREVAARAGVSQTLVSFYLTGRQAVGAETARRIQAAIDELDYHPNGVARGLRLKRSSFVGVMVPSLLNPSFAIMATTAEAALTRGQLLALVCSTGEDPEHAHAYFEALRTSRAEGLIVFPSSAIADQIRAVARRGTPVVLMERDMPGGHDAPLMDAVIADNASGVRQATEHLLALGHTRIGLLNLPAGSGSGEQRAEGYRQAFAAHGGALDPHLITWEPGTVQAGHDAIRALMELPDRPTAVVVAANRQTVGALVAIRELGLEMPGDISVVGLGHPGFEFWPAIPLTVISHDASAVGRMAAELLLARVRGEEAGPSRTVTLPTQLQVRSSTGPPATPAST
ncbi:MAG TPA: LacI family DNA-binding transcriptional regulator [Chloroflexota bacterium]